MALCVASARRALSTEPVRGYQDRLGGSGAHVLGKAIHRQPIAELAAATHATHGQPRGEAQSVFNGRRERPEAREAEGGVLQHAAPQLTDDAGRAAAC